VEAGAECLQRGLKPFHRVFLLGMVETFVVHAGDAQHHAQVAALGQEGGLIPEPYRLM
jgi:hypothetical protein